MNKALKAVISIKNFDDFYWKTQPFVQQIPRLSGECHPRIKCSSPDFSSICLIQRLGPFLELATPPLLPMCAISNPFPTGRYTVLTTRVPRWRTPCHLNPETLLWFTFLRTKTAPLWLILANISTFPKSLRRQSTTRKSTSSSVAAASSASPTITSGDVTPASCMALMYASFDRSSGTMHTCRPHVWLAAMARPALVVTTPPCDYVSTIIFAFQPPAMAAISSATPDCLKTSDCTSD